MEEAIDLATSEDDEPAVQARGLCIHCGQVRKPHVCPHGAKIMKRMSKFECGMNNKSQKTTDSQHDGKEEEKQEQAGAKRKHSATARTNKNSEPRTACSVQVRA